MLLSAQSVMKVIERQQFSIMGSFDSRFKSQRQDIWLAYLTCIVLKQERIWHPVCWTDQNWIRRLPLCSSVKHLPASAGDMGTKIPPASKPIHGWFVNVWQKPLQYCKIISLQIIKINENKKKKKTYFLTQKSNPFFFFIKPNWLA